MPRFANKVVIVTGSSAGIGKTLIIAFAKEGASVVLHGTNSGRLADAEKALLAAGIPEKRILRIQGQLNDDAVQEKLINETVDHFGKIDVLVNNAGVYKKPGEANAIENYDYVFDINVRAVFRLVELAVPHLEKTRGNIVNISSIFSEMKAIDAGIDGVVYGMSKAAVDRFTKNISQSLMKKGIRINSINPGPFESNIHGRSLGVETTASETAEKTDGLVKILSKTTAIGRFGRPEELVAPTLLLADEKSEFITGSIWAVDGGMTNWAPEPTDLVL